MAMKRMAPGWLTWALCAALVAIFIGERLLVDKGVARQLFSGGGLLVVAGAIAWRAASWLGARGQRRRIERILLVCYAGVAGALLLYFLPILADPGDEPGRGWTMLRVAWPIALAASILPAMAAQWALGPLSAASDEAVAEAHRVSELAQAGLTVAFAAAFLFVGVWIARERDAKWDVSYFKTSSPGSASVNMVSTFDAPLEVYLFFPPVNEVKDEVRGYFEQLKEATGNVTIEELDRMVDGKRAADFRVNKDATVVLAKGEQHRSIVLDEDIKKARAKLRELDAEVQEALYKVAVDARTAYLVVGHGEINDPAVTDRDPRDPLQKVTILRELLTALNYKVKELGIRQGLSNQVPDDASLVLLLGPTEPLLDTELQSLADYAARGGALLIALEPGTEVTLGPLAARLGVEFAPAQLADTTTFARTSPQVTDADHANIVTDQFSAHASVTSLSRVRAGAGILVIGAGSLEDADFAADYGEAKPRRTYVIRTLTSTFRDLDGDFAFDDDAEKRASYNLAAAVEGPSPAQAAAEDEDEATDAKDVPEPMRAFILADVQMLTDGPMAQWVLHRALFLDALKWLGGEEKYTGEVTSEKDIPIEHTKGKDVVWFYSTIIGAPLLVLGLGLAGVRFRRKRLRARAS